jgi:hypothetical protein
MSCLDSIIGLSNRPCECTDKDLPKDAAESKSGYFIDDMFDNTNLFALQSSLSCQDALWEVMDNAREKAISEFPSTLMGVILEHNERAIQDWSGVIGDVSKANKVHQLDEPVCGVYFGPKPSTPLSTVMKIKSLGVMTNTAGTYTVNIFNAKDLSYAIQTYSIVQTKAFNETVVNLDKPALLPMYDEYGMPIKYFITYERGAAQPMNSKFWCDCSATPYWPRLVDHYGISFDGSDEDDIKKESRMTNGIVLNASFICSNSWMFRDWDYQSEVWPKTMAKTIQLMAILSTQQYILNSNNVNRYTSLIEPEHLMGKMKSVAKQIEGRLNYLAMNLPHEAADCWSCKSSTMMVTPMV